MVSFTYNVDSINLFIQNGKRTKAQIALAMLQYNKDGVNYSTFRNVGNALGGEVTAKGNVAVLMKK